MPRWINRAALVVRPAKPFLEWAASLDDASPQELRGYVKERLSIYLVAEDPEEKEESAPIERYFEEIFERELESWSTDEDEWPQERSYSLFQKWFDVTAESVVTDLETSPIRVER